MINYFAVFDFPVSLSVSAEDVEAAWLDATRSSHPDHHDEVADDSVAELNQARATLTDPVERLGHWLVIKRGDSEPVRSIAPSLMDLFATINSALETADSVISRFEKSTTAIAKAMLAKETVAAQLAVQSQMQTIHAQKNALVDRFPEFETASESGSFDEATRCLAQLKFLSKWEQQCQARLLALLAT